MKRWEWFIDVEIKTRKGFEGVYKQIAEAEGVQEYLDNPLLVEREGHRYLSFLLPGGIDAECAASAALVAVRKMGFEIRGMNMKKEYT